MAKQNFCVARVETRTRASVSKFERHIERKNESYENMNVDLSRTTMNVHFKGCGELTYNETLDQMIAEGRVSLKGLKADATVFNEMIMDVNTDYFEQHGGYEYACRFYEAAFHFAENLSKYTAFKWFYNKSYCGAAAAGKHDGYSGDAG